MVFSNLPIRILLLILGCVAAGVLWQQAQLSVLALSRIDPVPEARAMVAEERYADAGDYLAFFLDYDYVRENPAAQALHAEIEEVRNSVAYQASKLGEGLLAGTSDETIGKTPASSPTFSSSAISAIWPDRAASGRGAKRWTR